MGHKTSTTPSAVLALVAGSVAALTLVAAAGRPLWSPDVSPAALDGGVEHAAATASPAVVLIQHQGVLGSGEVVDARGYIVTNYHVLYGSW